MLNESKVAKISLAPFCSSLIALRDSKFDVSEFRYDPFEDKDVLFEEPNELLDKIEDPDVSFDSPDIELVPSLCITEFKIGLLWR